MNQLGGGGGGGGGGGQPPPKLKMINVLATTQFNIISISLLAKTSSQRNKIGEKAMIMCNTISGMVYQPILAQPSYVHEHLKGEQLPLIGYAILRSIIQVMYL